MPGTTLQLERLTRADRRWRRLAQHAQITRGRLQGSDLDAFLRKAKTRSEHAHHDLLEFKRQIAMEDGAAT